MKKNILFGIAFIWVSFFFYSQSAQAEVLNKEIFSLEEPTWIFKTGMSRGKYHDRQDLGLVVNAGATIKIRKANTNDGYKNLSLWLLGNDRNQEKSVTITNDWQVIKVEASGVPFINTPYGQKNTKIEYEIEGSTSKLPIYHQGSNEQSFFSEWDQTNASFGLVQSEKFQLLVPVKEKEKAKKLNDFNNLDAYIAYQDSILTYYDEVMGLSTSDSGINKIPKNRFFLKADKGAPSGVGAYYGNDYAANGDATVVDMWMAKWDWGTLHELGHAYQPSYNNKGMYTGEVSNNLLAVLFTYENRGKTTGDLKSWLYNYGKKESVETSLYDCLVNQKMGYPALDHRRRLILLTNLIQSAGKENWTKLNTLYREAVNTANTTIQNMTLPDLFTMVYSSQTKRDYSPVFAKWGLSLNETRQPVINRGNNYPAVASLVDVVPKKKLTDAMTALSDKLFIDSKFGLVTNEDIKELDLPGGSLTIHLAIEEFTQLKGKKLIVKNGPQVVKELTITTPDIEIPQIANGIYTLAFPKTESFYTIDNYYAYVRDRQNETTVRFNPLKGSNLFDETITFRGLSYAFATLKTDFQNQKLTVDTFLEKPHSYYGGKLYASVEVLDELGKSIYKKDIEGTNVKIEKVDLPLKEGYQINIYHAETKNRLLTTTPGLIDTMSKTNHLLVKKNYLVNQNGKYGLTNIVDKIIAKINRLEADRELGEIAESPEKDQIVIAILSLPEAERDKLIKDYQNFLNLTPGTITVQYLEEDGNPVEEAIIKSGRFGEALMIQAKEISNYELISEKKTIEVSYGLTPQQYTFVYKKKAESSESHSEETSITKETSENSSEETNITTESSENSSEETNITTESSESSSEETSTTTGSSESSSEETSTTTESSESSSEETSTPTEPSDSSSEETSTTTEPSESSSEETSTTTDSDRSKTNFLMKDVYLKQGEKWNPVDHLDVLVVANKIYSFEEGVQLKALTYTPDTLDTNKPGSYKINFTLDTSKLPKLRSTNKLLRALTISEPEILVKQATVHVASTTNSSETGATNDNGTPMSSIISSSEEEASNTQAIKEAERFSKDLINYRKFPNTGEKSTNSLVKVIGYFILLFGICLIKNYKRMSIK